MAFMRDKEGKPMRDGNGNVKVTITEAQAAAREAYAQRRKDKLERIKERQEARAKRTPQQQLERLDMLLGKGLGATKERARLTRLIGAEG